MSSLISCTVRQLVSQLAPTVPGMPPLEMNLSTPDVWVLRTDLACLGDMNEHVHWLQITSLSSTQGYLQLYVHT